MKRLKDEGYRVAVTHLQAPIVIHGKYRTLQGRGLTRVYVFKQDGQGEKCITVGTARCSEKDTFVKRIGTAIALARAVENLRKAGYCK